MGEQKNRFHTWIFLSSTTSLFLLLFIFLCIRKNNWKINFSCRTISRKVWNEMSVNCVVFFVFVCDWFFLAEICLLRDKLSGSFLWMIFSFSYWFYNELFWAFLSFFRDFFTNFYGSFSTNKNLSIFPNQSLINLLLIQHMPRRKLY
jgi:hypothetical protein